MLADVTLPQTDMSGEPADANLLEDFFATSWPFVDFPDSCPLDVEMSDLEPLEPDDELLKKPGISKLAVLL